MTDKLLRLTVPEAGAQVEFWFYDLAFRKVRTHTNVTEFLEVYESVGTYLVASQIPIQIWSIIFLVIYDT